MNLAPILKTEMLFNDENAEKLGTDPEYIWGVFYLDLREVIGFGEFVINGRVDEDLTEIIIKNIGGRVLNIPVKKFARQMDKVWGNW